MSAYTQALRTLAEILEANPEWGRRARFNASGYISGGGELNIHPRDARIGAEVRRALGGEWAAGCTSDGDVRWTSAYDLCGFREVTIFKAQS